MSAAVESTPHIFGRHSLLNGMAHPHQGRDGLPADEYDGRHYIHRQPSSRQAPDLKLPPMVLPSVTARHSSHLPPNPGLRPSQYSDYATPSPVGKTPPQFPSSHGNDLHSHYRRAPESHLSPAQSSTASDRSGEETSQERRLQQLSSLRDHHPPAQIPQLAHSYASHPPPHVRNDYVDPSLMYYQGMPQAPPSRMPTHNQAYPVERPNPHPPTTYSCHFPGQVNTHHVDTQNAVARRTSSPPKEARPMSISNILDSGSGQNEPSTLATPSKPPAATESIYRISVRQQPSAARSCGFGERDRRVIDPPPIVQLTINDPSLSSEEASELLGQQGSVIHCSIWDEHGTRDMSSMPDDFRAQRRLMGTLVASPFLADDENGEEGCFFCFPDLSCRTPGTFRLKFVLVILDPTRNAVGDRYGFLATVLSEPFQVYNAKDFPGMQASTPLTKKLKEQGCLISIKKGNEKRGNSHPANEASDDSDGDENGNRNRPRKRARK